MTATSKASSICLTSPLSYCRSLARVPQKCKEIAPTTFPALLWMFAGLYSVAKSQFNTNISGSTYSVPLCDILFMFVALCMLYKGIMWKNMPMTLPWLILTVFSLVYNQLAGIQANMTTLKQVRVFSYLPWVNVAANTFLMIVRVTLVLRVLQLYVYWWFRKKLDTMKN